MKQRTYKCWVIESKQNGVYGPIVERWETSGRCVGETPMLFVSRTAARSYCAKGERPTKVKVTVEVSL